MPQISPFDLESEGIFFVTNQTRGWFQKADGKSSYQDESAGSVNSGKSWQTKYQQHWKQKKRRTRTRVNTAAETGEEPSKHQSNINFIDLLYFRRIHFDLNSYIETVTLDK